MIRNAAKVGVLGGFVIAIAALYPMINIAAPDLFPKWVRPVQSELLHIFLLMLSGLVGGFFLLGLGAMAARKSEARGWQNGLKMSAFAGTLAALLSYLIWLLPLNALIAYSRVFRHFSKMGMNMELSFQALERYIAAFNEGAYWIELVVGIAILFWAAQGAYVGKRQSDLPEPERPSLLKLNKRGLHPRAWFANDECASSVGVVVGLSIGIMLIVMMFSGFSSVSSARDWLEIMNENSPQPNMMENPIANIFAALSPLMMMIVLFFGAFVVLGMKNPASLFAARFKGIMSASMIISLFLSLVWLRLLYFFAGLIPFVYLHDQATSNVDIDQATVWLQTKMVGVDVPTSIMFVIIVLPWIMLIVAAAFGLAMGIVETLVFAPTIPLVHKRPVDKAAFILRKLSKKPENTMLEIYALFQRDEEAHEALPHMAVRAYGRMPDVSRLSGALHTLGNLDAVEERMEATDELYHTLDEHPDWRLSSQLREMMGALGAVLRAKSLDQILAIEPPQPQQTSSLPPTMVKSVDLVSRVVAELDKVGKVDDLPTQLIFLENALQLIHDAQRFVDAEATQPTYSRSPLPEMVALADMFDHWQGVVLTAVKNLKGRAHLVCTLQTCQCPIAPQLPIVIEVANQGLNVAQNVRLNLLAGEDYHRNGDEGGWVEILPPGETRQIEVVIAPIENRSRARVAWEMTYNDAVDDNRRLEFADVVEFFNLDKPFERIFPIPYVTGTPLKTDDVFVGREDVFTFMRENLLGAHQNNVIILHGQRRTGKTSVLYRMGEVMAETHYGALIDMQGKPARGEADFLYSIADDIVFALEDHDIEIDLPPREAFEEAPEFYFRSRFIRSLRPHLNGKNLLLMFDEFEELQRRVEDGRLQPEIFQFLRNLMQHEERVDFVFSGTHKLEELGAEYWSVLFNIAAYKPITFLSPNDMRRLILEPVAKYQIEYDPLALEKITAVTAGHPYFAQLLLHEMIVLHNELQRSYLTVNDVNRAIDRIAERGEAHFKYIWAESSDEERVALQGLTELLVGEQQVHVHKLRNYLTDRGYESADAWERALANLEGRDILARKNAKSPLYRFKVDLIRLWVNRTRPAL